MEFFRIKQDIPFMRHALVLNAISVITFLAAVAFLFINGLALSIEFTGGTIMEVSYRQTAPVEDVRSALQGMGYADPQVQKFGSSRDLLIRLPLANEKSQDEVRRVFEAIKELGPANGGVAELRRVEFVGPQVGSELAINGLTALAFVVVGIMAYLAMRFEWKFAVAAIVANLHDVVIILGFFAAFQWEFSLSVLAAILAVLGYSVNESVVVADRIRENFRRMRKASVAEVIDHAITSTMSRTIITHGTTETMVLAMLLFGGPVLHYFAMALTIGIVFGIYSSVFVMAPITMWLGIRREDLVKPAANQAFVD
ncbi:MAG: protein translocase subunit SecF [Betaproteobacteria bacterium]|nr:protein translocase subunit SecF [Betaproteobacteria bacterium]